MKNSDIYCISLSDIDSYNIDYRTQELFKVEINSNLLFTLVKDTKNGFVEEIFTGEFIKTEEGQFPFKFNFNSDIKLYNYLLKYPLFISKNKLYRPFKKGNEMLINDIMHHKNEVENYINSKKCNALAVLGEHKEILDTIINKVIKINKTI